MRSTLTVVAILAFSGCADAPPAPKSNAPGSSVSSRSTDPIPETSEVHESVDLGVVDADPNQAVDAELIVVDFGVVDADPDQEAVDAELIVVDFGVVDAEPDVEVVDAESPTEDQEISNEIWLEIMELELNPLFEITEVFVGDQNRHSWIEEGRWGRDPEYDWLEVRSQVEEVPEVCYLGRPEVNNTVFERPGFDQMTILEQWHAPLPGGFPYFRGEILRRGVLYLYCLFSDESYSLDIVEYEMAERSNSIHFDGEWQCICPSSQEEVTSCNGEGECQ